MKQHEDINNLLARHFADEHLSIEQQKQLEAWIMANQTEYRQLEKLMKMRPAPAECPHFDAEEAWQKVEPQLGGRSFSLNRERKLFVYLSAAASLLVLVVMVAMWLFGRADMEAIHYANNTQDIRQIVLPDSSEVVLYPQSALTYEHDRHTRLKGKAFFHVKKKSGKSFVVETHHLSVTVLGTSFLINAEQVQETGVFVESGKVKVTTESSEVILRPNEKAELKDGKLQLGNIQNPQSFFGKGEQQILMFNQTPIVDVIQEIEKQTGIQIELGKGFESNTITTQVDVDNAGSIAAELAFLCGCKCDTIVQGKYYKLYYE